MGECHKQIRSGWLDRVSRILAGFSAFVLLAMMGVTFVGVVMRYAFNAPILGNNEIVQLLAVALVMLALPYATQTEAHVRVDVFDRMIGRWGRFAGDVVSRGLTILVFCFLARRAWLKALDAAEFGDATNMLGLPIWPLYGLITLGFALCTVVLALQIVARLQQGARAYD